MQLIGISYATLNAEQPIERAHNLLLPQNQTIFNEFLRM